MSKEILIIVSGGIVQEVHNIPPHVTVRVKDYDVDGVDESRVQQNRDGERFVESVWTHEDSCGAV